MHSHPTTSEAQVYGFLSGGGEMGHLTREFDWGSTAVGTPEHWPQSLRTILSALLHSKFPMVLFWGPELLSFYNDAFRPSLGQNGKHPSILGQRAEKAWAEIWDLIKPLIDQVLAGGEATWSEDQLIPIYRNGKIEDVYWTFSYSPAYDETGRPAGVLVTCNETTEKVLNLLRLKESKDELAFAVEAAELGAWDYNPLTGKFSANHRLKEWFGLTSEENIDLQLALDAIVEEDRLRVARAIQQALEYSSGGLYDISYSIVSKLTGRKRIVQAKGLAAFNDEKQAFRLNGTLQDITTQMITAKELKESGQRFQAAVKAVQGIVWTNNAEGRMEGEQQAWASLTGQTYEQYQDYGWAQAVHPDDAQPTIDAWNKAVAQRKTFNFEHRVKMKDGNWGRFSVQAVPILDHEGKIREWVGVHTDITEQRRTEEILQESESRFRTLAETLPQLVWMTDNNGLQLFASSRWKEYSGIEPTGMETWQQIIHPDDLEQIGRQWADSMNYKTVYRSEARLRAVTGHYRWHYVQGEPIRNDKGEVIKWIGSWTDIHDQKESEQELEALVAQRTADLARSNEDLEQFAHVASHDLKEPVRKIRLFAGRMQEELKDELPERGKAYLGRINVAAERMLNMIEGVLAYSSNDRSQEKIEKLHLQDIVQDIKTDLDMLFHQKRAQLFFQDLPVLEGAKVLIYQLFYNLINNSLKFVRPDTLPEIRISSSKLSIGGREYVKILVSDNGIGFRQENAGKIFDSFARLHSKDKYEGTGLGLALCRKIVLRHHGTIEARGELNTGALFEVTLPVIQTNKSL